MLPVSTLESPWEVQSLSTCISLICSGTSPVFSLGEYSHTKHKPMSWKESICVWKSLITSFLTDITRFWTDLINLGWFQPFRYLGLSFYRSHPFLDWSQHFGLISHLLKLVLFLWANLTFVSWGKQDCGSLYYCGDQVMNFIHNLLD